MIFHKRGDVLPPFSNPTLNGHELVRVNNFEYLGIVFDSQFSLKKNILVYLVIS